MVSSCEFISLIKRYSTKLCYILFFSHSFYRRISNLESKKKKKKITKTADEHLAELMPIFERLRAQEQIPCVYPLHMGAGGTAFIRGGSSRSTPLSPHAPHCHPSTHWVS